jgi:hypothetical protein
MSVQLPQTNPGFNNTPFKFTKYSNAYMLVYIREADKDKIVCNVDEKDIAEHLQVINLIVKLLPSLLHVQGWCLYFCPEQEFYANLDSDCF